MAAEARANGSPPQPQEKGHTYTGSPEEILDMMSRRGDIHGIQYAPELDSFSRNERMLRAYDVAARRIRDLHGQISSIEGFGLAKHVASAKIPDIEKDRYSVLKSELERWLKIYGSIGYEFES